MCLMCSLFKFIRTTSYFAKTLFIRDTFRRTTVIPKTINTSRLAIRIGTGSAVYFIIATKIKVKLHIYIYRLSIETPPP